MATRGLALAERTGLSLHVYGVLLVVNRAESLFHMGRWAEAEDTITAGFDRGIEGGVASALFQFRGRIRALSGRTADAAEDLHVATSRAAWAGMQFTLQVEHTAAEIARTQGDFATARAHVAETLDPDANDLMERYRWPLAWLGLRIEAEAAEPEADRVAAVVAFCEKLSAATPPQRAYRALAAADAARASGRPADWGAALEACREGGNPYLIAYALVRVGEVAVAAGDREAAAAPLEEAVRLTEALGATPLLEEARALARHARVQLDGVPGPSSGEADDDPFGLTEREREVLALVAEGRSNPEIAKTLYMSPKTASVHVSNIMGKLGVTNRGEAAAFAHRHGLARSLSS
jgi:DNA-binding CsgD family transcriptional regulator